MRPGAVSPLIVGLTGIRPTFTDRVRRDEACDIRVVLMVLPAVTGYGRAAEAGNGCNDRGQSGGYESRNDELAHGGVRFSLAGPQGPLM